MDYYVKNNDIILSQPDLDLRETLDCGQAFRWTEIAGDDLTYTGYFLNSRLTVTQLKKGEFLFRNVTEEEFLSKWLGYFDLETDYGELKRLFSEDETLSKACSFAGGIRLLRQNSWECLISFIISQNNNIPRIKGIIQRLCDNSGGRFPAPEEMARETPESLSYLRSGFRGKYLCDAAQKVAGGIIDLDKIAEMPLEDARAALKTIVGVGPKVAECVLLYGMHRTEAFPVDVWIKRVLEEYYPNGFPEFTGENAGIAQQYLFHYIRNLRK